jgi:hypothetical protein
MERVIAKLILDREVRGVREIELPAGKVVIGRGASAEIQLDEPGISSQHCELVVTEISVTARDLGSTNGSFVDEQRIEKAVLQPGQILRLANMAMRFEREEVRISIPELSSPSEPTSVTLTDGSISCVNHLEIAAVFRCVQCGHVFCPDCIRTLPRISGGVLRFCPNCPNAQCVSLNRSLSKQGKGIERLFKWIRRKGQ